MEPLISERSRDNETIAELLDGLSGAAYDWGQASERDVAAHGPTALASGEVLTAVDYRNLKQDELQEIIEALADCARAVNDIAPLQRLAPATVALARRALMLLRGKGE